MCVRNEVTIRSLIISFLPVCSNRYWYVIAYFCLYVFIPILNTAVNKMKEKQLYFSLFAMLVSFSILPTILRVDMFGLQGGYSGLWLIILYFVGATIKRVKILESLSLNKSLMIYLVSVFTTLLSKNVIQYICINYLGNSDNGGMMFVSYISPTIICEAIMLLNIISKLSISDKMKKWIKNIAPLSFGVYLIHVHPLIFAEMKGMFSSFTNMNIIVMVLAIFLTSGIIFAVCIVIDYIRERMFIKLKIKEKLLIFDKLI